MINQTEDQLAGDGDKTVNRIVEDLMLDDWFHLRAKVCKKRQWKINFFSIGVGRFSCVITSNG